MINVEGNEKGYTLIETLIATILLAVGVVTVLQLFSGGLRSVAISENYRLAITQGQKKMEEILLSESLSVGTTTGVFEDGLQWRVETSLMEDDNNKMPVTCFNIKVVVEWLDGIRKREVAFDTIKIAGRIKDDKKESDL